MGEQNVDPMQVLAFKKLLMYIRMMKKRIIYKDEAKLAIKIVDKLPYKPSEEVEVGIIMMGSWIRIFVLIFDNFKPNEYVNIADIFYKILRLQEQYMEFSFGISKNDELIIKQDIHIRALTFDVFEEEYNAVLESYKKFMDEVLPLIKQGKSTIIEEIT